MLRQPLVKTGLVQFACQSAQENIYLVNIVLKTSNHVYNPYQSYGEFRFNETAHLELL